MLPHIIHPEYFLSTISLLHIPVSPRFYQAWKSSTAETQYCKFETNIPRKGIARPQSQFPRSCVCERFIYSHNVVCLFCCRKICGPIRGILYINRSQTHESGNWNWDPAIPFLEIHKWGFRSRVTDPRPSLLALLTPWKVLSQTMVSYRDNSLYRDKVLIH